MPFKLPPTDAITDQVKKAADSFADTGTFMTSAKTGLDSFGSATKSVTSAVAEGASRLESFNDRRFDTRVINPSMTTAGQPTKQNTNPDAKNAVDVMHNLLHWNDNVLSSLQQPAYKIRFYMVEDTPLMFSKYKSYEEFVKGSIHSRKQTTIATTGVSDINITRLVIQTVAAPNAATRSMAATNITLELKEPMGVSLLDMMARAAEELGIRNFSKAFYMLELSFQGYKEDGTFEYNPCSHFKNGGVWLYQVGIKNIDTEMNDAGGKYILTMIPYEEKMYDESDLRLPDTLVIEGTTVQQMLQGLAEKLNKSVEDMYGYPTKVYKFNIADFEYKFNKVSPKDFTVKIAKEEFAHKRALTMEESAGQNGAIKAHFNKGLAINDAVELIFANTTQAQELGITTTEGYEKDLKEKKMRETIIFRIEVTSDIGIRDAKTGEEKANVYDWVNQNYIIEYTLHVVPYYTQMPILSQHDVIVSQDPKIQAENATKLRKEGYLVKRYDYLFTGMNTEVWRFDIKYNLDWQAALPRVMGFGTSVESTTHHDKFNPSIETQAKESQLNLIEMNNKYRSLLETKRTLDDDIAKYKKEDGNEDKVKELEAKKENLLENERLLNRSLGQQRSIVGEQVAKVNAEKEKSVHRRLPDLSKHRFAENVLEDFNIGKRFNLPISFVQSSADTRFVASGAISDSYTNNRSVYGAIMDQLYGPMSTGLQKATIELKGDPYWLGYGNMERSFKLNSFDYSKDHRKIEAPSFDANRPDYGKGDILYMVTFRYPKGFDANAQPLITTDDFFTGVYMAKQITHTFESGQFRQSIEGLRMPLIDVFKAFGYRDDENQKTPSKTIPNTPKNTEKGEPVKQPEKEVTTEDKTIIAKEPNVVSEKKADEAMNTIPSGVKSKTAVVENAPPTDEQKATDAPTTEPFVETPKGPATREEEAAQPAEPPSKLSGAEADAARKELQRLKIELSSHKAEQAITRQEIRDQGGSLNLSKEVNQAYNSRLVEEQAAINKLEGKISKLENQLS